MITKKIISSFSIIVLGVLTLLSTRGKTYIFEKVLQRPTILSQGNRFNGHYFVKGNINIAFLKRMTMLKVVLFRRYWCISSNGQSLLFFWASTLNLWHLKWLKPSQIAKWSLIWTFRPMIWALWYLTTSKFKLRKIIKLIFLRKLQMHQYLLNKSPL